MSTIHWSAGDIPIFYNKPFTLILWRNTKGLIKESTKRRAYSVHSNRARCQDSGVLFHIWPITHCQLLKKLLNFSVAHLWNGLKKNLYLFFSNCKYPCSFPLLPQVSWCNVSNIHTIGSSTLLGCFWCKKTDTSLILPEQREVSLFGHQRLLYRLCCSSS